MNVEQESDRIDRVLASFGDAPAISIGGIIERLIEAGTAIPPDQRRSLIGMRIMGEPLLDGLAGVIQRANALGLARGEPPISAEDAVAAIEHARPWATGSEIEAALREFSAHLRREGARLTASAALLRAETSAIRAERAPDGSDA